MKNKYLGNFLIISLCITAFFIRTLDVNWDDNFHLHPDERFLTMVVNGISWPKNITEYFNTNISPLNPHNRGYNLYVYGTFPLFFTKLAVDFLHLNDYNNTAIIGRYFSALVDTGTVFLIFLLAKGLQGREEKKKAFPLLAAFLYTVSVLPIQISHFFAVDTYFNFFTILSLYFLIKLLFLSEKSMKKQKEFILSFFVGISFGLALASKISALIFIPVVVGAFFLAILQEKKFTRLCFYLLIIVISTYFSFRIFQPYAFADGTFFSFHLNSKFLANLSELQSFDTPKAMFPPAVQWLDRPIFLFPLKSIALWGLGIPLAVLSYISILLFSLEIILNLINKITKRIDWKNWINQKEAILGTLLVLFWAVFLYQGSRYTMNMRYFILLYPLMALSTGYLLVRLCRERTGGLNILLGNKIALGIIGISILIWPISFLAIYERPHSRVTASYWIYNNIPPGKTITFEIWDDALPLSFADENSSRYKIVDMPFYDGESSGKWQKIMKNLESADYIIMSSNRLWASIPRVPYRYPITAKYYHALFDGSLGFVPVADIKSTPCFPSASLCLYSFDDSKAEESFTVFDHPEVLIFKKEKLNITLVNIWISQSRSITGMENE